MAMRTGHDTWEQATADPALVVADAAIAVEHALAHLPPKTVLQLVEFMRRRMNAIEAVAPSPSGSLPYRLFSFRYAPSENALASR